MITTVSNYPVLKKVMSGYFFITLSCICILPGLHTEECSQTVLAKRNTVFVPQGGSLSLSCVVQHCGEDGWSGGWVWRQLAQEVFLKPSLKHRLSNQTLSVNQTRLFVEFINVNQSDEGSYGCKVTWAMGNLDQGQFIYLNITSALPSERNVLYRVLLCVAASLCFPLALGLACCLRSEVKPQSLPRTLSISPTQSRAPSVFQPCLAPKPPPRCPVPQRDSSTRKANPKPKPKKELVYAALSQDALGQQRATNREPAHSTVYSSLRFSGLQPKQGGTTRALCADDKVWM